MQFPSRLFFTIFWLAAQFVAQAFEPTTVDGIVTIDVDHSKPIWTITVTNQSDQELSYEMMGKVARSLGLEVWGTHDDHAGLRIHAEDLAESLNTDGFPADIRKILPGKSATFQLNPRSMSSTNEMAFLKWKEAEQNGYYNCRIFFGIYSSRLLKMSPPEKPKNTTPPKDTTAWNPSLIEDPKEEKPFGIHLRRMFDAKDLALISWHRSSGTRDDYYVTFTTSTKADFEKMAPWDGSQSMEKEMHELVTTAHKIAQVKIAECKFEELMITPCEDDPRKHYLSIWFMGDTDETTIDLLMNGSPTKTVKLAVTEKQYDELSEHGIPKLRKKD